MEVDRDDINRQQRIILIAEGYDYALLIAAEWLSEQYGVDITCCRIAVAKDSATDSEYLVCSNVYPAPELAKESVSRGRKHGGTSKVKWPDWKAALAGVTNPAVTSYFEQESAADRESYLRKRILRYRLGGKRRWFMAARNKNAYVWQQGRFEGDIDFWKKGLSDPEVVKPVKDGQCLRLFLDTADRLSVLPRRGDPTTPVSRSGWEECRMRNWTKRTLLRMNKMPEIVSSVNCSLECSMKLIWQFESDDIARVKSFIDQPSDNPFVMKRISTNLRDDKPPITNDVSGREWLGAC